MKAMVYEISIILNIFKIKSSNIRIYIRLYPILSVNIRFLPTDNFAIMMTNLFSLKAHHDFPL